MKQSLLAYNTFGIEVYASDFLEYASVEELKRYIAEGRISSPFLHIGGGSNLLFTKDYEGTVLHSRIQGVEVLEETPEYIVVRVGAGMEWDAFVAHCVQQGWHGAENLSLIPGEVGAAAVQNIGAYGVEVKDLICELETIDIQGNEKIYTAEECGYAYRFSIFKQPAMKGVFITYVRFRLSKSPQYHLDYGTIREELAKHSRLTPSVLRQVIVDIRQSKLPDPKVLGNVGSFFMNPVVERSHWECLLKKYPRMPYYDQGEKVKIPAGWMIEQCGWKGKALGRAAVHDKQALVLVNLGGATGEDIVRLSDAVRASVQQEFGVDLHPEVNFI